MRDGNLAWVFLAFVGFGLLLTFTPCVLPMIPIISGIIVGQGKKLTTSRAFLLSLTYVLAMAVTYAIAGIVVGLLGANVQAALQNPWVLTVFSLIFVLLSLSMFGLYELQMPSAIQSHLTNHSNAQKAGAFVGVAVMGVLSALICGPCITAPLVAALIVIGETGSAVRGGVALFALGLGMGIPLAHHRHLRRTPGAQSRRLDERGEARVRRDDAGGRHLVHVPHPAGPGDPGPVGRARHRLRHLSRRPGTRHQRLAPALERTRASSRCSTDHPAGRRSDWG